jgi:SAM-dependent methyltransferase
LKQNIYDNPIFFAKYVELRRTESGLNKALEEPAMHGLIPALTGIKILDIGCGFGKYCRYYADRGAAKVVGIDISSNMISLAREMNAAPEIEYHNIAFEDVAFEPLSFDFVSSSLTIHYIDDYENAISKIATLLKPKGKFIFSVEHPIATALPEQRWLTDEKTNQNYWPVDNYAIEGPRKTNWFVDNVIKYHRTVSTYVNVLLQYGFSIDHLGEPVPSPGNIAQRAELELFNRRPALLILSAQKL